MSKKRNPKKRKKNPKPSADFVEKKLLNIFNKQINKVFSTKQLLKKLNLANSIDAINSALEKLDKAGKIKTIAEDKYKWKKNKSRALDTPRTGGKSAIGTIDVTRTGSAYVVCPDLDLEKDVFIPAHRCQNALHGDTVEIRWFLSRRGKPEGEVLRVTKRRRDQFMGNLTLSNKFAFVTPDDPNINYDIALSRKDVEETYQTGDKVVVRITEWHTDRNSSPKGELVTNFGKAGGNDIEMKSILVQKGFNLAFPDDVLQENAVIPEEISAEEIANRRDMRKILTFTIDPDTAKDFDDAISVELLENNNYEIGVHIADVSHYVKPGTALDTEAASRTTSVYLVDRVLPMLPEKLSNGVCSLRPHEEKLTFSAVFEFTPEGKVISEWFGKTVTYSDRRFTYEEAQEGLESGEGDYADELRLLNKFAYALRAERFKTGAINFESPEVKFKLNEKSEPVDVYLKSRKDAHMLVEDFMLLANRRVGALMDGMLERGEPQWAYVYRIHDEPDMEKVEKFGNFASQMGYIVKPSGPDDVKNSFSMMLKRAEGKPEFNVLQQLAIRTMSKAAYSTDNIGHYGLGFATYSHFTSPIRRYADVLAHRILFEYLNKKTSFPNKAKLQELCKHISKKERDAMEAERESVKYKQAEYIEQQVGKAFSGNITGITERGIFVQIQENFCEGMIKYSDMFEPFVMHESRFAINSAKRSYKMGDQVWVRVLDADKLKRKINLSLLDPKVAAPKETAEVEKQPVEKAEPKLPEIVEEKISPSKKKPEVRFDTDLNEAYAKLIKSSINRYEQSDAKLLADKSEAKWAVQWSQTALLENNTLLLSFNPRGTAQEVTTPQSLLTTKVYKPEESKMSSFVRKNLKSAALTSGYFVPFASLDELQLSAKDIELSIPLFKQWLKLVDPTKIISFSNNLKQAMLKHKLLYKVKEHSFEQDANTVTVTTATVRVGRQSRPIFFLPSPKLRLPTSLKSKAWDAFLIEEEA